MYNNQFIINNNNRKHESNGTKIKFERIRVPSADWQQWQRENG